jgi:hypothetical protein
MLNRQLGDPFGNVTRCQAAVASCRDEVADLENQLETARGRLHRAAESLVDWQERAGEVQAASVRRSDTADLLLPAKQALTDAQVRRMAAVRSQAPGRRPKGHGGVAVRSHLECVYCQQENVDPETSALLHLDPQHDVPITTAAQLAQKAERRGLVGSAREIAR